MFGLYLKDLLLFKKHWLKMKYILLFILGLTIAIFLLKEDSIVVSIFITMFILNSIQLFFIEDMKSGWIEFLNATPLSSTKIVFSRFLSSLTIALFSSIISFMINILLYFIFRSNTIKVYLLIALIVLVIAIVYILIFLPFTYLFDQNGLFIAIAALFGLSFLLAQTNKFGINISEAIESYSQVQLGIFLVLGIIILGIISFTVSKVVYEKRFIGN